MLMEVLTLKNAGLEIVSSRLDYFLLHLKQSLTVLTPKILLFEMKLGAPNIPFS